MQLPHSHTPSHTQTQGAPPIIGSMNVGVHPCVCAATSVALYDNNKMKTALSASSHSFKANKAASSPSDDYYAFVLLPTDKHRRITTYVCACACV